jgi:hypothetical protein
MCISYQSVCVSYNVYALSSYTVFTVDVITFDTYISQEGRLFECMLVACKNLGCHLTYIVPKHIRFTHNKFPYQSIRNIGVHIVDALSVNCMYVTKGIIMVLINRVLYYLYKVYQCKLHSSIRFVQRELIKVDLVSVHVRRI